MPPRVPGTLSNVTLSLKFMQRGLAADQKPVEAEKAKLVDDSHWEIVHSPEKKALLNTERQKEFDVTYEASYLPFLYESETNASGEGPGPSLPSVNAVAFSGRRVFRGGQEVNAQTDTVAEPQEDQQEETRDSSPTLQEEAGDIPPEPNNSRKPGQRPRPLFRQRVDPPSDGKPQFLRPVDVDVPAAQASGVKHTESRGKSRSDMLSEMIASAKTSTPATSKIAPDHIGLRGETRTRRKATEDDEEARPRKKPKKNKVGAPS